MINVNAATRGLCISVASAYCLFLSVGSQAGLITPTAVTATDTFSNFIATNLVNDSGVSTPVNELSSHASISPSNSWVTNDRNGGTGDYFSNGQNPELVFDLGGTFTLSSVFIWNYALNNVSGSGTDTYNGNQAKSIDLTFSTTGVSGTFSGMQSITLAADNGPVTAQEILLANVTADAVKFTITDNFFDSNRDSSGFPGGDRVGLSEVKFSDVPEPASLALFGLGLAGLGWKRRKQA